MKKNEAIERLLKKSDLPFEEQVTAKSALVSLLEAKERLKILNIPDNRTDIQKNLNASINDSIAYLCMTTVKPDVVIGREINTLTEINTENIGS